jgi:multicomponent Na+:H+ antiporter subunit B
VRAFATLLALALGSIVLAALTALGGAGAARPGEPGEVAAHYLAEAEEATGMRNVVGSVLVHYRGFDTFVEVVVIFTALTAIVGIGLAAAPSPSRPRTVPIDPVVRFVVALLAPYVALFALALLVRGHASPGGGFSSGAVVAALLVAVAFVARAAPPPRARAGGALALAQAAAPVAFAVVLTSTAAGWLDGRGAREATGTLLEAAIAVTAAIVLARAFGALHGAAPDAGQDRSEPSGGPP